jgi:hypothetical protein
MPDNLVNVQAPGSAAIKQLAGRNPQAASLTALNNWNLIVSELDKKDITDAYNLCAVAATVSVETGNYFCPIREFGDLKELYRLYGNYYGRGFIQLTWRDNYKQCGQALGLDLISNPDLMLVPDPAAQALAWFWKAHGIATIAAQAALYPRRSAGRLIVWKRVRTAVNGGENGLSSFLEVLTMLGII